ESIELDEPVRELDTVEEDDRVVFLRLDTESGSPLCVVDPPQDRVGRNRSPLPAGQGLQVRHEGLLLSHSCWPSDEERQHHQQHACSPYHEEALLRSHSGYVQQPGIAMMLSPCALRPFFVPLWIRRGGPAGTT